ncbi:hypothetical protein Q7C_22 [Methylophaga frappieri]|uniref:DUF4388 domain-containing protein n=1 Tax=Methylophaga frappieri (strain ATCC BAA-2434 / DSM 25690 / JAM7) TaxID=754477 RepID=I1YE64_METFJ|nr:hypothetical protein [Methylophaga frappieri]AFJ01207.1 hypothetical protein Q7C_22 [Methylophaga frappieri]
MLETTELFCIILRHCAEGDSGTLFLTTTDNKACHVVFDKGRIVAMSCGTTRGADVADMLPKLTIQACQFNSALQMPLSSRANIAAEQDIFSRLGIRRQPIDAPQPEMQQRVYRGQKFAVAIDTKPQPDSSLKPATKSKRIYRGQVIQDD